MNTISLCMIVKNEEEVLFNCLNSVKDVVEEIIIVDTGSSDNTKKIAQKFTDKIYDFKWCDDFAKARNFSFSKATKDYILWLDADDYVNDENKDKLLKLKKILNGDVDMYYFLYDFNDNYQPFYRERLLLRKNNYQFKGKVHEAIIPFGIRSYENITINQNDKNKPLTNRNLKIFESMDKNEFTSRDYYYYGRELFRHKKYGKSKIMFNKFIKSKESKYYEDVIDANCILALLKQMENDTNGALKYLFNTFIYDLPRVNVLCEIGNIYYNQKKITEAIYYYKMALNNKNISNNSFIHKDYLGFTPSIMLCLCYDQIKDFYKANEYNELANQYKPNNIYYLENKKYFENKLK